MKPYTLCILLISLFLGKWGTTDVSLEVVKKIYVSPEGNDANDGSKAHPFSTLVRAKKEVRDLLKESTDQDIEVIIRKGIYFLDNTLVFTPEDSPANGFNVTYKTYPGEEPIISSGHPLKSWKKATEYPTGLPEEAKGMVWEVEVPEKTGYVYSLYDEYERQPRARSEGFQPTKKAEKTYEFAYREEQKDFYTLHFPEGKIKNWENLQDAEIFIRPKWPWVVNLLKLEEVNEAENYATTNLFGTYTLTQLKFGGTDISKSIWVENIAEFLDKPGEWIYLSKEKKIYWWPKEGKPSNSTYFPTLKEYIRLEGDFEKRKWVKNIEFEGLTFVHGARDTWTEEDAGLQHDWEMYDKGNALLRLRGAEKCTIKNCIFTSSSGSAIRLDLHSQENRILSNKIDDIGGTGILLAGYGPGTKDENKNNEVLGNHISRTGQIYWHSIGIFIWQSGENRIAGNLLHDLPSHGIAISGVRPEDFVRKNIGLRRENTPTIRFDELENVNVEKEFGTLEDWEDVLPYLHSRNNIVENNEIYRVVDKLDDANGIYLSGANEGNIVRNNYLYDLLALGVHEAIRCDDYQRGTLIENNIIYHSVFGGITIKGRNNIINNYIIDLLPVTKADGTKVPVHSYIELTGPVKDSKVRNNILFHKGGRISFYRNNRGFLFTSPDSLEKIDIDNNLLYHQQTPTWSQFYLDSLQQRGVEKHSISANPEFKNLPNDFLLKESSPAHNLGIETLKKSEVSFESY